VADVGVVILAGGLARRMQGQDKGLVKLCDKPMVQWTLDVVRQFSNDIVINTNRNHDAYGHLGPLAGLYAAMQVLDNDYIFMCPCDSPFVELTLLNKLNEALNNGDTNSSSKTVEIAVAHDGDRLQPVFAMVSSALADSLDNFLLSGERKIDKWYGMHNMLAVNCHDCAASFRNINTEEERIAAELDIA